MPELSLSLCGERAEPVASELCAFLANEFALETPPTPHRPESAELPGNTRATDPVSLAALIVAIPGALLASVEVAERAQLGQRLQRLIDWAGNQRQQRAIRIWPEIGEMATQSLDELNPEQIIDWIAEHHEH